MNRDIKDKNFLYYHKGFTLAETLITLVVIGVVAALTVPTLIVKHQKEETVTRLKRVYSTVSQVTNKSIADNGPIASWKIESGKTKEFVEQYMAPYLNITMNCGYDNTGDCSFVRANLNTPQTKTAFARSFYRIVLADGTALFFNVGVRDEVRNNITIPRSWANVMIDINGHKGPNVMGKDVFYFIYWIQNDWSPVGLSDTSGTFLPNGSTQAADGSTRAYYKSNCNKDGNGWLCAALIMADNWQIKDDYPW